MKENDKYKEELSAIKNAQHLAFLHKILKQFNNPYPKDTLEHAAYESIQFGL